MELLRKFMARPWADRLFLLRALALVGSVRLALGLLPYRTVQRLLSTARRTPGETFQTPAEAWAYRRRVVGAVEAVGRRTLGDKPCLTQALVVQRMLRQKGYETALRIGVAKDGQELLAHAWLERDGRVVIGGQSSQVRYAPLVPVQPGAS